MTDDIFENFEQEEASPDQLGKISSLGEELVIKVTKVKSLEQQLKDAKLDLRDLEENTLPEAMNEIGMTQFKLISGETVSVEDVIRASIPKDRQEVAHKWLEEHGHGDIIKHNVSVQFKKSEEEKVKLCLEVLNDSGFTAMDKKDVHWKTLTSLVKEVLDKGQDVPYDDLGVFIGRKAKVK